jgi:hypothetical protein
MNIKAEEGSDAEVEVDLAPITFLEIKAETEVSCMPLYIDCLAGNTDMQKYQFYFRSPSLSVHVKRFLKCLRQL